MDLRNPLNRLRILEEIDIPENKARKDDSYRATQIYNGRLRQYVKEHLETLFSSKSVEKMPIQSGSNLARRIVQEKASVYKDAPTRHFTGVTPEQEEVLQKIYGDMKADFLLSQANAFYALQNQCLLQVYPKQGKFNLRVLKLHQVDVIPMPDNPEEMLAVIISPHDNSFKRNDHHDQSGISRPYKSGQSDGVDQAIADEDDTTAQIYEVWTREYYNADTEEMVPALNFIMNDRGEVLSEDVLSPIPMLPFVDVAGYKDFQFYADETNALVDFTVQFNAVMTEIAQILRTQGFSQAVITGPKSVIAKQNFDIGPNTVLKIPSDLDEGAASFSFQTPGGSVQHAIEFAETLLAQFLSCNGVDPKVVSSESGQRFASGIERLLSQIERFDASKQDYSLFDEVEYKLFHIIHNFYNALVDTDGLMDRYRMPALADDVDINVTFSRPEGAQTLVDKVNTQEKLMAAGLASRVTAVMDIYNMERAEAEEFIAKLDADEKLLMPLTEVVNIPNVQDQIANVPVDQDQFSLPGLEDDID